MFNPELLRIFVQNNPMDKKNREFIVSNKLREMGTALVLEGIEIKSDSLTHVGTMISLISTIMLNDVDRFVFSQLCSMFSAKKILENIDEFPELKRYNDYLMGKDTENTTPETPKKIRKGARKPKNGPDNPETNNDEK